jgi:hypothetical protein
VCYTLRPQSLWWLMPPLVLGLNKLFLDMTPPSTLAALLSTLFVLLILNAREKQWPSATLALAGACAGILLATRLDTGVMFMLVTLPYVCVLAGRRALIMPAFAAAYFAAFDPFFWVNPLEHAASVLTQAYANHLVEVGFLGSRHSLILPLIGVCMAIAYVYLRPYYSTVPKDYLLWLLGASCLIVGALLISPYHPVRYFFPLMTVWEVFVPLLVLELVQRAPAYLRRSPLSPEFLVFLWLFLDRFPPAFYLVLKNLLPLGFRL